MLVDVGRQAGKHGLIAVAFQLQALIKQRRHFKAVLQAESERDEGKGKSHLGCGLNEKMAYKVTGRILKR